MPRLERAGHPSLAKTPAPWPASRRLGVALSLVAARRGSRRRHDRLLAAAGVAGIARVCAEQGIPLVVGTTGFDAGQRETLDGVRDSIPILIAPNMSRAVNLLDAAGGRGRPLSGASADIAIIERHHRTKKDAPSGTALRLAEFASRRSKADNPMPPGAPVDSKIHIAALRIADSPGEHTVIFAMLGETLELTHRALNRDGFARGALDAARFLAGKPAGLYSMEDVLGC